MRNAFRDWIKFREEDDGIYKNLVDGIIARGGLVSHLSNMFVSL